jgi:hypothetical protein
MRIRSKINSLLGLLAGGILSLFGKSPKTPGTDDLRRADFKTSTQRLGVRFSEKVRDVFRFKWLKMTNRNTARHDNHSKRNENPHSSR